MLEPVVMRLVRRNLRGIWVSGLPKPGPAVWAANHHSYWDPFVGTAIARSRGQRSCVLMLQQNLGQFAFARAIGAFGTKEIRRGLAYLAQGRVLLIYPEGELRPAGPVTVVSRGANWYAAKAGVPLYVMATRVVMRGHQAAEAYVSFYPAGGDVEAQLNMALSEMDDLIAKTGPREPLPGFTQVIRGRRSPEERMPWAR
jgi:1-acyl-sn-glycerol-3-phosphate acyltransferase